MSRRACESCRIRKVKCSAGHPCAQCAQFDLPCAVVVGGPKRSNPVRGRLIERARQDGDDGIKSLPSVVPGPASSSSASFSPASFSSASFSSAFFFDLLPAFEQSVYPFNPVICPDDIYHAIQVMDSSVEDCALVFAFAAATLFLAAEPSDATSSVSPARRTIRTQIDTLIQKSLNAHKRLDDLHRVVGDEDDDGTTEFMVAEEPPVTIKRIVTCIFLEIAMMAFRNYTRSFSLLREAISMLQILQLRCPSIAAGNGGDDAARYQRLYWEAFIHERFLTIAAGFPSILPPLPGTDIRGHGHDPDQGVSLLPDPTVPAHIKLGFGRLVQLFLIIDDQFLAYWWQQGPGQTLGDDDPAVAIAWIEAKQVQLDEDEADVQQIADASEDGVAGLTELQHADLFVTRLWMRTLVWQLALARGLLRSDPSAHYHPGHNAIHDGLSLHFPAQRLSVQLRLLVSRLASVASIGQQGSGIVQKLFEITSTIADVLTLPRSVEHQGQEEHEGQRTRRDVADFVFLVQFISQFSRIREQQKAYLWDKVDQLRA